MKNIIFNKFIQEVNKIHMTRLEKDVMLKRILGKDVTIPVTVSKQAQKSYWNVLTIRSWVEMHRTVTFAVTAVIIVFMGGRVVSAAERSLPGSIWYPVKISITEPLQESFIADTASKAEFQTQLIAKRMSEVEQLMVADELDEKKQERVERLIDERVAILQKNTDTLKNEGQLDKADEIEVALEAEVNVHARIVSKIARVKMPKNNVAMMSTAVADTVSLATESAEKAPQISAKMMSVSAPVETTSTSTSISEEIKAGASKRNSNEQRASSETKNTKELHAVPSFSDKIGRIKDTISDTNSLLEKVATGTSEFRDSIVDETHGILDDAKKYADEADESEKKGEKEKAYKSLRDSERSVKEAKVILDKGIKLDGEFKKNEKNHDK